MKIHLPTAFKDLRDASKQLFLLLGDAAFLISSLNGAEPADIARGRRSIEAATAEMGKLTFVLQLLNSLQYAREGNWQEAYSQIEAAREFTRGNTDLMEAWSLVRYQLDDMRLAASEASQQG